MSGEAELQSKASWTWADQISTYRFWGLLAFYALSAAASVSLQVFMVPAVVALGIPRGTLGLVFVIMSLAGIYGFCLAWAAARSRTKSMLFFFALLQLIGVALFAVAGMVGTAAGVATLFLGALFFGVGSGAVLVSVPAIIAGGRGGIEAFVVAFGVVFVMSRLVQVPSSLILGVLIDLVGDDQSRVSVVAAFVILGLLFLIPVNQSLSHKPPSHCVGEGVSW